MSKISITYVTSSDHKLDELDVIQQECKLGDGRLVGDAFDFDVRSIAVKETLDVAIETMVTAEARAAYSATRVPVIVEHAGLIFEDLSSTGYPGGLTKPMWNSLRDGFLTETNSAGRRVTARACIGYCDGQQTRVFTGETAGTLSDAPRGSRDFYWDIVFVPLDDNPDSLTYAEIVGDPARGLRQKIVKYSQSRKALVAFLDWRLSHDPQLWKITE